MTSYRKKLNITFQFHLNKEYHCVLIINCCNSAFVFVILSVDQVVSKLFHEAQRHNLVPPRCCGFCYIDSKINQRPSETSSIIVNVTNTVDHHHHI